MGEYNDDVGSTEPPLPDLLAFETVPNLCELRAIVKILRMPSSPCYRNQPPPAWISFACRDDMHLTSGELLDDALAIIDQANFNESVLCAVGVNCMPPQFAPALVARIHAQLPGMLILCYPNRGEEWDAEQRGWRPLTGVGGACEFARVLVECRRRGGRVLGGKRDVLGLRVIHYLDDEPSSNIHAHTGCCRTSYEDISVARRELSNDTLRETHASTTFHS